MQCTTGLVNEEPSSTVAQSGQSPKWRLGKIGWLHFLKMVQIRKCLVVLCSILFLWASLSHQTIGLSFAGRVFDTGAGRGDSWMQLNSEGCGSRDHLGWQSAWSTWERKRVSDECIWKREMLKAVVPFVASASGSCWKKKKKEEEKEDLEMCRVQRLG